jgi:phosphatidylinositol alpha-mannosyltransferase
MLKAWPEVHRQTGARLRLVGADPLAVRLLLTRLRLPDDGIDLLGAIGNDELTEELLAAKALAAPSMGAESFGMVLTRALACATPVVASDITGYRDVMTSESGLLVPPGNVDALVAALVGLLADEPRRRELGAAARAHADENYGWDRIARRLATIYGLVAAGRPVPAAVA